MQDRYKFRVWNKLSNIMTYNVFIGNFLQDHKGFRKVDCIGVSYEPEYICFMDTGIKNLELMQCTGLKDKNGKLIFEGDIVRLSNDYDVINLIAKVVWEDCGWALEYINQKEVGIKTGGCCITDWTEGKEVIGNIYENPELLEVQNG